MSVTTKTLALVLGSLPNAVTRKRGQKHLYEFSEPPLVFTRTSKKKGPPNGPCWKCEMTIGLTDEQAAKYSASPSPELWIRTELLGKRGASVKNPTYDQEKRQLSFVAYFT